MYVPKRRHQYLQNVTVDLEINRGMALDNSVYAEPTQFNPNRYLSKSRGGNAEPHLDAAFGFGRRQICLIFVTNSFAHTVVHRICPGRYLATASIWIAVAIIFTTVNITKAKDEDGNEITPELDFETGITRCVTHLHLHLHCFKQHVAVQNVFNAKRHLDQTKLFTLFLVNLMRCHSRKTHYTCHNWICSSICLAPSHWPLLLLNNTEASVASVTLLQNVTSQNARDAPCSGVSHKNGVLTNQHHRLVVCVSCYWAGKKEDIQFSNTASLAGTDWSVDLDSPGGSYCVPSTLTDVVRPLHLISLTKLCP